MCSVARSCAGAAFSDQRSMRWSDRDGLHHSLSDLRFAARAPDDYVSSHGVLRKCFDDDGGDSGPVARRRSSSVQERDSDRFQRELEALEPKEDQLTELLLAGHAR